MKLEKQVCSLSLAKELKEAGYPQEGLWWWVDTGFITKDPFAIKHYQSNRFNDYKIKYVAPTVAELGEALPVGSISNKFKWRDKPSGWRCRRIGDFLNNKKDNMMESPTEADARAKMWLYLKKEGLL